MLRRRFLFWVGFGLFNLGEKLHAAGFDRLAAKLAETGETKAAPKVGIHWRAASNNTWQWWERETLIDGHWTVTGITTPIHKRTGELYTGKTGYLDDSLVPADLRLAQHADEEPFLLEDDPAPENHQPHPIRKARHGRPPSKWLRSLRAEELRTWLATIDVPEAGVEGMTFWEHLTRDHYFDPVKIRGLNEAEQAQLHAAAHFGY